MAKEEVNPDEEGKENVAVVKSDVDSEDDREWSDDIYIYIYMARYGNLILSRCVLADWRQMFGLDAGATIVSACC